MIKVAVAEDNTFLADSLRQKLELFPEIKLKYIAQNGEELVNYLKEDSNIDIILMDIQMPKMDGIEATREVTNKYPHIKTIMLTVMDSEKLIYESLQAGATGYLLKESKALEIYQSIENTVNNGAALSPSIALKAINFIKNPASVGQEKKSHNLTSREEEVLIHLSKGLSNNDISLNLNISVHTIRKHIENIYRKLEVGNKIEAVQLANKYHWI